MNARTELTSAPSSGKFWALAPVLILGAMFAGWGIMLSYALDDPSFGVEPNYYQKAVSFDAYQAQERENQRLGFQLSVSAEPTPNLSARLQVRVVDRKGRPLEGARVRLVTFHLARSSRFIEAELREHQPGLFMSEVAMDRAGLWELRFQVERAGDLFTSVTRLELEGARP